MSLTYLCPRCHAVLNPNVRVVLVARFADREGLVLLSPKLGDYKFHCDRGFCENIAEGDLLEFFCPVCANALTAPNADHFTQLLTADPDAPEKPTCVLRFSRMCGEHATFLYDGETVQEFGEDALHFHGPMIIEGDWGW